MKYFLYSFVLIFFVGCNGIDKPKKPDNLITKEKMSNIMYDLYILNAAKGVNKKVLELNGIMPLEYVYKKYDIDSLQFAESNTYYAYDTKTYTAIVEKVRADLQKDKDMYDKLNKDEQKVQDSIAEANKKVKDSLKTIDKSSFN